MEARGASPGRSKQRPNAPVPITGRLAPDAGQRFAAVGTRPVLFDSTIEHQESISLDHRRVAVVAPRVLPFPDLARQAASVTCVCHARLARLLSVSLPSITCAGPAEARLYPAAIDLIVAAGSLGAAFRRDEAAFPGTPYLAARPEARRRWAERLGPRAESLRVGLSWRGGLPTTRRSTRSSARSPRAPRGASSRSWTGTSSAASRGR